MQQLIQKYAAQEAEARKARSDHARVSPQLKAHAAELDAKTKAVEEAEAAKEQAKATYLTATQNDPVYQILDADVQSRKNLKEQAEALVPAKANA